MTGALEVRRLGRTAFADALALQHELVEARADGWITDVAILTEHDPVVTVGRRTPPDAVAGVRLPVVEVERGGEATYHGPGQLVCYPIVDLAPRGRDLRRYLRDLEEVVIGVLGELDLEGERRPGLTGVWLSGRKVCSIGVAVRRWVAYHGFALNLHTDLSAFRAFRPCGLDPDVMTRVADHVDLPPTNLLGEVLVVKHLCRVLDLELPPPPAPEPGRFPPLPLLP